LIPAPPGPAIRRAVATDAAALIALYETEPVLTAEELRHQLGMALDYEPPSGILLLTGPDGRPEGACFVLAHAAFEEIPAALYVSNLFVAPGRREQGRGGALLAAVEAEARRAGLGFTRMVRPDPPRLLRRYERLGYVVDDLDYFMDRPVAPAPAMAGAA
jgi:GNAT superfamily N-acetyltransferase